MEDVINRKRVRVYSKDRVYHANIDMELRASNGDMNKPVFAASCNIYKNGYTYCGGQCFDKLLEFIPTKKVKRIYNVWKDWHLNDLHAGCIHQREFEKEPYENHQGHHCDICDYTYGTKWIYEPIPEKILNEINKIMK